MNLQGLETLVAISETRSFMEAARRLDVSQSTVSMQIKALEAELKIELFDRSTRPSVMTPAGIVITRTAREVLNGIEDIRRSAQSESDLAGALRLGAVQTATLVLLPMCLTTVIRTHPGMKISVQSGLSGALTQQLLDGELDAIVVTEPKVVPPELRCELVLREQLALVSGGDRRVASVAELVHQPFIRFNRRVGVGAIVEEYLNHVRVTPEEFMELDSIEAILAVVERGLGVAIVPERSIGQANRHRVSVSPIEDEQAYRNVSFLCRVNSTKTQLLRVVLDALRAAARRL
jgi:DNA-binding transcriptional LysR family regulator